MASHKEHMMQAQHNEKIADVLLNPKCSSPTWVIVITFYAALQYLEAAATNFPIQHLQDYYNHQKKNDTKYIKSLHAASEDFIKKEIKSESLYDNYHELRKASESVRYLKGNYYYFGDEEARELFEDCFLCIKNYLIRNNLIY